MRGVRATLALYGIFVCCCVPAVPMALFAASPWWPVGWVLMMVSFVLVVRPLVWCVSVGVRNGL